MGLASLKYITKNFLFHFNAILSNNFAPIDPQLLVPELLVHICVKFTLYIKFVSNISTQIGPKGMYKVK